ncbi:hypothetical protein CBER1_03872 [Cercospora berteroae]|uniref:polynucleotide adenylyltransferase n=1 Tax=Cercospora berteroae TaxID=357750 RepID=A0A2S6CEB3_9PEZI|nr:hypothetical protein CBER1_03872 [Cercospora berteroae]
MGDSYHPPRYRDNRYSDRYSPPPRRDHYDSYRDDHHRDSGYSFRGASERTDSYRPPRSDFTFQAAGLPAPRFPPAPRDHKPPSRPRQDFRRGRGGRGGGRGGRGGRPFVPKPAHKRAILGFTEPDEAPEEMFGTSEHAKFRDTDSSDDEDEEDNSADEEHARKRVKTTDDAQQPARPQWSNPDPYSVLPPTDVVNTAKKDIVQTIRKRKAEVAASEAAAANSIKDNADFISFNFDDDEPKEESEAASDSSEGDDEDLIGAPPPPPPQDFVMPTDEELMQNYANAGAGRGKRKRGLEQTLPSSAGTIVDEWLPDGSDMTPWLTSDSGFQSNVGLQLHKEIIDFSHYVAPRPYEQKARRDLIDRIERVVRRAPDGADVEIRSFGSFASDLYLPTADMDLVAVSRSYLSWMRPVFCQTNTKMFKLAALLKRYNIPKDDMVTVITKAKVPILKFVDAKTGIKVDISFENDSGLKALPTFSAWKERFRHMPVLVMIIKQFLVMRGLNEVFLGGIGGFTIICLVTSMLQHMPETDLESDELGYGELLQNFFDLYGNKFDIENTGIMMEPARRFRKGIDHVQCKINYDTLTIVDPNRPENDISGGSRHIDKVFKCFRGAYNEIQKRLNDVRTGKVKSRSILGCILGGNYSSFEAQRSLLHALDSQRSTGVPPAPPPRSYPSYPQYPTQPLPARPPPPARPTYPPPPQLGSQSGATRPKGKKQAGATAAAPPVAQGNGNTNAKAKKPKWTKAQRKAAAAAAAEAEGAGAASSSNAPPTQKASTNPTENASTKKQKKKAKKVMEPKLSKNDKPGRKALRERKIATRAAKKAASGTGPSGS